MYGKPYYRFSHILKVLNLPFDSILPEEISNYKGNLVLTTRKESPLKYKKPILHEDVFEQHFTVIRGLMIQKLNLDYEEKDLVIGIDPWGNELACQSFILEKRLKVLFIHHLKN